VSAPDPADATVVTVRVDLTQFAERVAQLVVRGLVARAAANELDERNGPFVPPDQMPPRGTVRWGEHQGGQK
jgi:hypothetical protein